MSSNNTNRRFSTQTLKQLTWFGYFGLLIFMPLWLFYLNPSEALSPGLSFAIFILPLLLPLKGIIQGNPYTFAWANFIVMLYFLHSLTTIYVSSSDRLWATIELILATIMFLAGTYYTKYRGQELGLKIKKLKQELAEEKELHHK
jgi:uncharacterized membrane protein